MTSPMDIDASSISTQLNRVLLYDSASGFLAGGLPVAWVSGMAAVEGVRVAHRLQKRHLSGLWVFTVTLNLMTMIMAGMFAAVIYHHLVEGFGRFDLVDKIYGLIKYHFAFCRLAVCLNQMYFLNRVWQDPGNVRGGSQTVMLFTLLCPMFTGGTGLSVVVSTHLYKETSYYAMLSQTMMWQLMFVTEFVCNFTLALIMIKTMYQANEFAKVKSFAGHRIRYGADVCLLLSQAPIYNTALAMISLILVGSLGTGARFILVFLGSQLAILGVFVAISSNISSSESRMTSTGASSRHNGDDKDLLAVLSNYNERMRDARLDEQRTVRTRIPPQRPPRPSVSELDDQDEDLDCPSGSLEPQVVEPARVQPMHRV